MSILRAAKEGAMEAAGALLRIPPLGRRLAAAADRFRLGPGLPPRLAGNTVPKFQILVYHRVLPSPDPFAIGAITEKEFVSQLEVLRACFRVISLDRLVEELDAGGPPPGTVCLTFDDGYRDNHDHAWPLLRRYGLPATIFLATGFIGTRRRPWHDTVLSAFKHAGARRFDFPAAGLIGEDISNAGSRSRTAFRILGWLKRHAPRERDALIGDIVKACGSPEEKEERLMLDWDEARAMHRDLIAFGGHTVNHPILSRLGPEEMETEIRDSKQAIEAALQAPVRHFAYPNGQPGDFNAATVELVRKLGFASAATTLTGVNDARSSRYEWMRRQPWDRTGNGFYLRMVMERLSA